MPDPIPAPAEPTAPAKADVPVVKREGKILPTGISVTKAGTFLHIWHADGTAEQSYDVSKAEMVLNGKKAEVKALQAGDSVVISLQGDAATKVEVTR